MVCPAAAACRIEVVSWKPRAFIYHNFLSDEEAEHMKRLAAPTVSSCKGCGLTEHAACAADSSSDSEQLQGVWANWACAADSSSDNEQLQGVWACGSGWTSRSNLTQPEQLHIQPLTAAACKAVQVHSGIRSRAGSVCGTALSKQQLHVHQGALYQRVGAVQTPSQRMRC
jgi:hypothetical protein